MCLKSLCLELTLGKEKCRSILIIHLSQTNSHGHQYHHLLLLSYSSSFRNTGNSLKPNQNTQPSRLVFSNLVGTAARISGRYFSGPSRIDLLTFHKCVKQVFHYWTTVLPDSAACGPFCYAAESENCSWLLFFVQNSTWTALEGMGKSVNLSFSFSVGEQIKF